MILKLLQQHIKRRPLTVSQHHAQGRRDIYAKRRGMDSGDMLEVAHMSLHVAQMISQEATNICFDAVTETPARILSLEDYACRLVTNSFP
jgi:hypothetical protein